MCKCPIYLQHSKKLPRFLYPGFMERTGSRKPYLTYSYIRDNLIEFVLFSYRCFRKTLNVQQNYYLLMFFQKFAGIR